MQVEAETVQPCDCNCCDCSFDKMKNELKGLDCKLRVQCASSNDCNTESPVVRASKQQVHLVCGGNEGPVGKG